MNQSEATSLAARKRGKWGYIWPMWTTLLLHLLAILLFTTGFLLTRTELPYHSHCSDVSHSPCFSSNNNGSCWTKPATNRLLIIVLDALRFDFVAPSTFFAESKPWMDKLRVLKNAASTRPLSARIFKAIADPPTTSLQRLKGLTTGGLPTFVDVGNSFGAPAIVEDNFINQLVQNGKKVVMMGDDTWTQLFPHHFERSYPYPSFNVKDLHTVDNGCIEHLLPSLYEEDWDVLIAHFLGVDHAGHIFGVDSTPMIEKLEQYNTILERVIEVLENQSGPGSSHENTMLVVMGDHGQTLNGDHGGGSAEEVETAIFAMSFKKPLSSVPSEFDSCSCQLDLDGKNVCISTMQQLDFAVTVSALLGIPFPYGSIGHINPELYALGADSWNSDASQKLSESDIWMQNYANALCINSWQVKRYVDAYSTSSAVGFSHDDLSRIASVYAQVENHWSHSTKKLLLDRQNDSDTLVPALKRQIDAYFKFLTTVSELARSKWTEFDLNMMGTGIGIMANKKHGVMFSSSGDSCIITGSIFTIFLLGIRACSFLSNMEEGKVANFLLSTSGIVTLRQSVIQGKLLKESIGFLILSTLCRFAIEVGLSKQAATSAFMKDYTSWIINIASGLPVWDYAAEVIPMVVLILLAAWLYKATSGSLFDWPWKYVILGTILSYMLIIVHWITDSDRFGGTLMPQNIGRTYIPRIIYAIALGQLLLLTFGQLFKNSSLDCKTILVAKTMAILSAWSSTVILLSGKQGPMVAFASIVGGALSFCALMLYKLAISCCMILQIHLCHGFTYAANICRLAMGYFIMKFVNVEGGKDEPHRSFSIMQWSLFATCLFFCSGHWCAFDGLRYGAAFIGFEEFVLVRQAILLAIDTFGFSIILPVFGLPLLVATKYQANLGKHFIFTQLSQMYTTYGLITAITTTFTILCVTIQRRHLMVWGLFAPKFVFDVFNLILTDDLKAEANAGDTEFQAGYSLLVIQSHDKTLQPDPCLKSTCVHGTKALLLYASIYLLALGGGGIRGCVPALGADQFDENKPKEGVQLASFFNWFLFSITIGASLGVTFVVYVSTESQWYKGFIISMSCSATGLIFIALGKRFYRARVPGESPLLSVLQVLVVTVKNWRVKVPLDSDELYEIQSHESNLKKKLIPHTNQFRVLDKAAVLPEGIEARRWKVCTVTQVEEVKILTRMMPILLSTIIMNTSLAQLQTFSIQQGTLMNTYIGKLNIPAASIPIIPLVFMTLLIPVYEFAFVPLVRRITGHPNGITELQRVGVGLVLSAISMVIAGAIEVKRKHEFNDHNQHRISLFWLSFHYAIFGIADMFTLVGLLEFFYKEAPQGMRSLSTSFSFLSLSIGYYLSTAFVELINLVTGKIAKSKKGWLEGRDLNRNHVELFYWFLAILSIINFVIYLMCAKWYKYQSVVPFDTGMLLKDPPPRNDENVYSTSFVSTVQNIPLNEEK
ncbi:Protein NRT1/ PTR FAMILY 4.5 [Glycine soja]